LSGVKLKVARAIEPIFLRTFDIRRKSYFSIFIFLLFYRKPQDNIGRGSAVSLPSKLTIENLKSQIARSNLTANRRIIQDSALPNPYAKLKIENCYDF
jgi:hypothetical protein